MASPHRSVELKLRRNAHNLAVRRKCRPSPAHRGTASGRSAQRSSISFHQNISFKFCLWGRLFNLQRVG